MSPQFVDFDQDGHLDIVAGTFDGSPHWARGDGKHWRQPEQILDKGAERIVINQFWNFDTKKWDSTKRCDPAGAPSQQGHLTSAIAWDHDGDGDLDLLLGDHDAGGYVWLRLNEGKAGTNVFAPKNTPLLADGKHLQVPGTVATMRLVDWNRDGLPDLACGSMGDAYGDGEGGGVSVWVNTGTTKGPVFGAPLALVPPSRKGAIDGPTRPDSGLYMDFADPDGDGDLDLIAGGYSHWTPNPPVLTDEQKERVKVLRAELATIDARLQKLYEEVDAQVKDLPEAEADQKRGELFAAQRDERGKLGKQRGALSQELDPLVPGPKRVSYVWLYENVTAAPARQPAAPGGAR